MATATETFTKAGQELFRVNNDGNGNPRHVVHYFALLTNSELESNALNWGLNQETAKKRANRIGGRVYRGKDFGGGLVFQGDARTISHNIDKLMEKVSI